MGVVMTGALGFVAQGQWITAMALYIFATIGFTGGNVFYDSLLVNVAGKKKMDGVSALGYGLGYLGGGILFGLNVLMTLKPHLFGIESSTEAVRISFIAVAIWWALFSLPIFLFVKEPVVGGAASGEESIVGAGFPSVVGQPSARSRQFRNVFLFLVGYSCSVDSVTPRSSWQWTTGCPSGLIGTVLSHQGPAPDPVDRHLPAAIIGQEIGEKFGTKTGIFIGISGLTSSWRFGEFS